MKKAFTLAEVLITLGIIGVVAAMTIPTLISNYQKKQWVAGLQKGYATMSNVAKRIMTDSDAQNLYHTEFGKAANDNDHDKMASVLKNYLKISKTCSSYNSEDSECFAPIYKTLNGEEIGRKNWQRLKIYSSDGMVFYFRGSHYTYTSGLDKEYESPLEIEIDVNGDSGPNQHGRDLFTLLLYENGSLLFSGGQWTDQHFDWSNPSGGCDPTGNYYYSGDYCGLRVLQEGWRMDY